MNVSIRYKGGRLQYTGRVNRAAFAAWCDSSEGQSILDPIVSNMGFVLFGKARTARRRLWRDLSQAARSGTVVAIVQREVDSYLGRLETLVHAHDLPCEGVNLRRLVAVPRLFANTIADRRIDLSLEAESAFSTRNGRERLREWFRLTLIEATESALVDARLSTTRPLPAGSEWEIVGVNQHFEWRVPLEGPAWPGHYYLLERTHQPTTRAIRKGAAEAIARMEMSLPALSRTHRNEILRQAGLSLERLLARQAAVAPRQSTSEPGRGVTQLARRV
jgi:hypothetical protein